LSIEAHVVSLYFSGISVQMMLLIGDWRALSL